MPNTKLCKLCGKLLSVPPNEVVSAGKDTHTLCAMTVEVSTVFEALGHIEKLLKQYNELQKYKQKHIQKEVNASNYLDLVQATVDNVHSKLRKGVTCV